MHASNLRFGSVDQKPKILRMTAYCSNLNFMPYDERLAERIQKVLVSRKGVTQQKMFGGLAFMLNGNMCCGVIKDFLVLRLGLELSQKALSEPHTKLFDLAGRVEKGIILVTPPGYESEDALRKWVERAVDFTSSLQPKAPKDHKTSRQGTVK